MKAFKMKKAVLVLIISICFAYSNIFAVETKGKILGQVVDSKTNAPMEFVSISVNKQNTTGGIPLGTVTDKEGKFIIENVSFGTYSLTVSFIGYTPFEKTITLSSASTIVNLKKVPLAENATMMEEVKVVGMKTQMKVDIDKKVFAIDQNIASTGGSATDVLSNVPSVEVDNEGGISLHGNSSVTIWINGKASGLTADNQSQVLEQLPAESIDKIEVITNPSAKYSPEGTAGIINIVLKKDRKAGYYGSIQAGADSRGGYNASANYNYSSSKLDAYASVNYHNRQMRGGGLTNRLNLSDSDTTFLNQVNNRKGSGSHAFTRLGMTWHLTPSDHFSVDGFGMFGDGDNKNTVDYLTDVANSFTSRKRITNSDDKMTGGNVDLGYKHEFGKDHYLDFRASYNKWGMDGSSVYDQSSIYADNRELLSYQRQENNINNHNWEIQLDYQNKINDNTKIEAGYKSTFSRENSPVETFSGATEAESHPETDLFNRFIYNMDVHALYGTYSGHIDKFGFQVGMRGEYSDMITWSPGYNQTKKDVDSYSNDYFSLFPSAFASYSLPNGNELQASYTRRISRPWGGQLNSFVNITDSTNISFGNPQLSPQFSNAFELNYLKTWEKHMLSVSGYYRNTNDVIQNINYLEDNVMKTTYENITRSASAGSEVVIKDEFFKILELTTTVNAYYYKLDGFSYLPEGETNAITGEGSNDFTWNARMIGNFKMPKAYSLQLTGNYNAKQIIAQGYQKAGYTMDAGLRKSFDKISISINARDLFDSRKRRTFTSGTGFSQYSERWWGGRQFGATITYSFGNMKPKKQTKDSSPQNVGGGYEMEGN